MNRTLRLFWLVIFSLFAIHIFICTAANEELPHIISANTVDERGNIVTRYGFANENGERIAETIYEKVSPFSSVGLALVYRNGFYGYIDTKGEFFMPVGLKEARPFNQFGLAIIKHNRSKWSVIDTEKYIIVKEIFDKIEDYQSNGLAIVKYGNKFGLVDTLGNVVLPVIYDKIENFDKSGYATIKDGNKFGIVDKRGRTSEETSGDLWQRHFWRTQRLRYRQREEDIGDRKQKTTDSECRHFPSTCRLMAHH